MKINSCICLLAVVSKVAVVTWQVMVAGWKCIFHNVERFLIYGASRQGSVAIWWWHVFCYMIRNQMVKDSLCPWSRWTSFGFSREKNIEAQRKHHYYIKTPPLHRRNAVKEQKTMMAHTVILLQAWTELFMVLCKSSILLSTVNR